MGRDGGLLATARDESVQSQLSLTESQKAKIAELAEQARPSVGDAVGRLRSAATDEERQAILEEMRQAREQRQKEADEALRDALTSEQFLRLEQIRLQRAGVRALTRDEIVSELKVTDDQKTQIESLMEERSAALRALGRRPTSEDMEQLNTQWDPKVLAVLSDQQRDQWRKKLGTATGGESSGQPSEPASADATSETDPAEAPAETDSTGTPSADSPRPAPTYSRGGSSFRSGSSFGGGSSRTAVASFDPATKGESAATDGGPSKGAEPADGPDQDGSRLMSFHFEDAPWKLVLNLFATRAGLDLDASEAPPGTFTYRADRNKYTPTEALDILNGYLIPKGYILTRRDRFLVVHKIDKGIPPSQIPDVAVEDLSARGRNELLRVVFRLRQGVDLAAAAKEAEALAGPQGKVVMLSASNALQVTDIGSNLLRMHKLMEDQQEKQDPDRPTFRLFQLKYASAYEAERLVRNQLGLAAQNAASSRSGNSGRSSREEYMRMMMSRYRGRGGNDDDDRRSRESSQSAPSAAASEPTSKVAADSRTNSLLVVAPFSKMELVEQIVDAIDVPVDGSADLVAAESGAPYLKVYKLRKVDSDEARDTLRALMPDGVVVNDDRREDTVHIFGSPEQHREVQALLREIDGEGDGQTVAVIPLSRTDPLAITSTLNMTFLGDGADAPSIQGDSLGRRLIVRGTFSQVTQIKTLLAQMGEDGTGRLTAGAGLGGPVRVIDLGNRDPREFVPMLESFLSNAVTNPIRVVVPTESGPVQGRRVPALDRSSFREREASPARRPADRPAADRPAPKRDERRPTASRSGGGVPVVTASRTSAPAELEDVSADDRIDEDEDGADAPVDPAESPEVRDRTPAREPDEPQQSDGSARGEEDDPARRIIQTGPQRKAPIAISIVGGRLVIASEDKEALEQVQQLVQALAGAVPAQSRWTVFYLRSADAAETALMLGQIFPSSSVTATSTDNGTGYSGGSSSLPMLPATADTLRIIPDLRSNSLLVSGPPHQVRDVENMLQVLDDDGSNLPESLRDRVPRMIPVRFADVNEVANIVREVYRDQMGGNDSRSGRDDNPYAMMFFGRDNGRSSRSGRRSGQQQEREIKLTVGVDARTSQLVVSANDGLFRQVEELVGQLDEAALVAQPTIQVYRPVNGDSQVIQQTLSAMVPNVQISVSSTGETRPTPGRTSSRSTPTRGGSSTPSRYGGGDQDQAERMQRIMEFRQRMEQMRSGDGGQSGYQGRGGWSGSRRDGGSRDSSRDSTRSRGGRGR